MFRRFQSSTDMVVHNMLTIPGMDPKSLQNQTYVKPESASVRLPRRFAHDAPLGPDSTTSENRLQLVMQ